MALLGLSSSCAIDKVMRNESVVMLGLMQKSHLELRSFPPQVTWWDMSESAQLAFEVGMGGPISPVEKLWSGDKGF